MKTFFASIALVVLAFVVMAFSLGPDFVGERKAYCASLRVESTNAYRLAVEAVGPATNRFVCVQTNECDLVCCEEHIDGRGDWKFLFADTNKPLMKVLVRSQWVAPTTNRFVCIKTNNYHLLANPLERIGGEGYWVMFVADFKSVVVQRKPWSDFGPDTNKVYVTVCDLDLL